MATEPEAGPQPFARQLLMELLDGGPDLPPARERWLSLLRDPSAQVRLATEVALIRLLRVELQTQSQGEAAARRPRRPHRVPQFGLTEPKRHCLRCFGHDFWVDANARLHCDRCEPLVVV
jgi:hypothetical protein